MKPNRIRYHYIKTAIVGFAGAYLSALSLMLLTVAFKEPVDGFFLYVTETALMVALPVSFIVLLIYAVEKANEDKRK